MIAHISIRRTVDSMLAASAMAATGAPGDNPPLLTPDHTPMLERAALAALRAVAFELAPFLDDVVLQGEPVDLEFVPEIDAAMRLPLEGAIEDIVAHRVLHSFFAVSWPALSAAHLAMAADAMERLQAGLLRRPCVGRIRPA